MSYRPHHNRAPSEGTHDPSPVDSPPSQPLLYTDDFRQPEYHSSHHYPPPDPVPVPEDHPPVPAILVPTSEPAPQVPVDLLANPALTPEVPAPPAAAAHTADLPVLPPSQEPQHGSLPALPPLPAFDPSPAIPHTSPP